MAIRSAWRHAPVAALAAAALSTGCVHTDSTARSGTAALPHRQASAAPDASVDRDASASRHRLLAIDPQARAYRVLIPQVYVADGDEYVSRVRICVTESGEVARVSIVEPSIPAVDDQLPDVIARWRYRPHVIDGQATAFCYPMNYRVH